MEKRGPKFQLGLLNKIEFGSNHAQIRNDADAIRQVQKFDFDKGILVNNQIPLLSC